MAVFKCKMCGGDLDVNDGVSVFECDYCGTRQTVPTPKDDNLKGLYNRANTMRLKSEFDKAEQLYEKIIESDETQAEAYWGIILCRYGIEYVEDPKTFKRVLTCHRTSFDSVISDEDYKSAISYADPIQKSIYEQEAAEIDRIQKEILAISAKEEPYDVFICYKETDENGKRTPDSVIANDIYYQLTDEGFKVFYAAISLEGKLGSAYEPCIFAALNSAKVMLVIGTKPEFFNAAWVKNEWSRFLKLMKGDRSRIIIPCYRDMDAYDLPDEFAHLQAQDMSKIGFINDLVRGINKVLGNEGKKAPAVEKSAALNTNAAIEPLLKRAYIFLEDGEWDKADDFCEQVLNINPECAEAYLGKLMVELRVRNEGELTVLGAALNDYPNYQKVLRYGDSELVRRFKEAISKAEDNKRQRLYNKAVEKMNTEADYIQARELFREIEGFKDAAELAEKCAGLAEEQHKEQIYKKGIGLMLENDEASFEEAKEVFNTILGYEDSKEMIIRCEQELKEIKEKEIKTLCARVDEIYSLIGNKKFADAAAIAKEIEVYEPNDVRIHIAKLLINYKVRNESELALQPVPGDKPLEKNEHYQKILELGDENTVARFKSIALEMNAVKKRYAPIGWLMGIVFLALSPLNMILEAFCPVKLPGIVLFLLPTVIVLIYAILTRVSGKGNKYDPGNFYMGFGMFSVASDIIVLFITMSSFSSIFAFIGRKVVQAIAWFIGVAICDFENYDDKLNQ